MTEEQIENILISINSGINGDDNKYTSEDIKSGTPNKPIGCHLIKENYLNPDYPLVFFGEWDGSHFYSYHVLSSYRGMQQIVPHEQDNVIGYIEYKRE